MVQVTLEDNECKFFLSGASSSGSICRAVRAINDNLVVRFGRGQLFIGVREARVQFLQGRIVVGDLDKARLDFVPNSLLLDFKVGGCHMFHFAEAGFEPATSWL
jgi:hypothetical protein